MKKMLILGTLATALIVGGGTGVYMAYAKDNTSSSAYVIHRQGSNMGQMMRQVSSSDNKNMEQMMKQFTSSDLKEMEQFMENGNVNFDQMKPYMKKMHPELSDKQLEDLYKSMHGKEGSCNAQKGKGMMGSNL